jgi:branched-chain amino acid transport system substrate-binding protein
VRTILALAIAAIFACLSVAAQAQDDVKIGVIASFTGPYSIWGREYTRGIELYQAMNGNTVDGKKIDVLYRDVGGSNPPRARQLTQDLILRDHVVALGGQELTPNVLAETDIINKVKIPFVIFNAGTATLTDASPFFVRAGYTNWADYYPLGVWAGQQGLKRCATIAADYAPGQDSLAAAKAGFESHGGKVVLELPVPLDTTDFSPYLQRIRDAAPQCTIVFMPLGPMSVAFVKAYLESGLQKAGIQLLCQSETNELDLPSFGDGAIGIVSTAVYGPELDNETNKKFSAAYRAKYGADSTPSMISVQGYDGMALLDHMIQATGGKPDGEAMIASLNNYSWNSPRGRVTMDGKTREPIQDIYIRKVEKVDGKLINQVIDTFKQQPEPWHATHTAQAAH